MSSETPPSTNHACDMKLYRILAENSRAGVYIVQDGKFRFINYNAALYAGYKPEEMIGLDADSLLYPEDRDTAKERAVKMLKGEESSPYEFRIVTRDGQRRWIMETVTRIEYEGKRAILGNSMDITEIREATERLKSLEEMESSILDAIPHAVLGGRNRIIVFANNALFDVFGWQPREVIGSETRILYTSDAEFERVGREIYSILAQKRTGSLYASCRRKDGTPIQCRLSASVIGDTLKDEGIVVVFEDVTEHKRLEAVLRQNEEKYRSILEGIEEGYYEVDLKGYLTLYNGNMARLLGYGEGELTGRNYAEVVDQANAEIVYRTFNEVFRTGLSTRQFDWELICKDGGRIIVETSVSLIRDTSGRPVGFRGILRDVTEQKKVEEMIRNLAFHDTLTGLPNRRLFKDRMNLAIAQAARDRNLIAVMMLDLDRFKLINDTLGHAIGDQLLQEVAGRLKSLLRQGDTVARMGGDEFMLLLPQGKDDSFGLEIACRVLETLQQPFILGPHTITLTTSIGIAFYPRDGQDDETLMKGADIAMYRAKEQGRNRYCLYSGSTSSRITSPNPEGG